MLPFRKRRRPPFKKWPELFLVALVEEYDNAPGTMSAQGFGQRPMDMAVKAGIMSGDVFNSEDYNNFLQGDHFASFQGVDMADVVEATGIMAGRKWAYSQRDEVLGSSWLPTLEGVDHAHRLMRPWALKLYHSIRGDLRTILVSVITAIAATILTTLILKIFGWLE